MTTKNKTRCKKVWHISRFRQRYELPEDIRFDRKSPLQYTKDFVGSGTDDESCGYFRQLMALRSKLNWLELRGAFSELKNVAGNQSKAYRGYLLDGGFVPATAKDIGRWLGVEEKRAEEILSDLSDVGLMELVDMPIIKIEDDGNKSRKKSPSKKKKKKKTKSKKASSKRKTADEKNHVRSRARTCAHVKARAPLKKKINVKTKTNVNVKTKANNCNDNDKNKRANNNGNGNRKHKANAQKEREHEGRTSTAPTTAPPLLPRQSDEGGSVIPFTGPPGSAKNNRGAQRLGDIVQGMIHRWDPDAKQFGAEVYQALELPWDPASAQGRRELGCFASVWMRAKQSGLPPPDLAQLRDRAIAEAAKLARKPPKRGKVSAVWCSVFNRILAARFQNKLCKAM